MSYGNYAPFYRGGYFNPMQSAQIPNMAENQGQYMPQYHQPMQTNPAPMVQPTNEMIWVLGQTEAESFLVAPNTSVVLWDKNNPTIYIKSVNAQGMPSMRVLDFVERSAESQNSGSNGSKTHHCTCGDKFATKEQINDLRGKIDDLTAKYEELSHPVVEKTKTTAKKSKEIDE